MVQSHVGKLIVASTLVSEPIFARGVCLMMHHDAEGAIGVMLNRPIFPHPTDLLKLLGGDEDSKTGEDSARERPGNPASGDRLQQLVGAATGSTPTLGAMGSVHFGGPLSGPVLALHGSADLAEAQTGDGIYVAAQRNHLEQLVRERQGVYRLIVGHAGWSAGQLDAEIDAGFWHLLPATAETVFSRDEDLWPLVVRRATGATVAKWVGAADTPDAAWLN